jgi:hypothetical protein
MGVTSIIARGRALPWLALYQTAKWIYEHGRRAWGNLTPTERRRLGELVRKSKGRRLNLSERERDELWSLTKKAGTRRP